MRALAFFAAISIACISTAVAQLPETPTALRDVYACAPIAEESQRLACYDAAVGRLQQAETDGRVVTVDREQVATLERESFGFTLPSIGNLLRRNQPETAELDRVEMQVERVLRRGDGTHSFVMTNGQTWTQVEAAPARNVEPGDSIAIRRAALGSFMLSPEHGRGHRVRRTE